MTVERVVWLTGMPRSGTNWVSQILASCPSVRLKLCPLFSYQFKDALDEKSSGAEWQRLFEQVYRTPGEYLDQEYLRRDGHVPRFAARDPEPRVLAIKSTRYHQLTEPILQRHDDIQFVALVRHPCAAIHSWLDNPLEFPAEADPAREWRSGAVRKTGPGEFWGFEDWLAVTEMHLRLEATWGPRFLLYRYEDFVDRVGRTTRELFDRLGLTFGPQTESFLSESQSRSSPHRRAVYKDPATADRWRAELAHPIRAAILSEVSATPAARFVER